MALSICTSAMILQKVKPHLTVLSYRVIGLFRQSKVGIIDTVMFGIGNFVNYSFVLLARWLRLY